MRPRCPTHDLVLGPTGECVLCRRTVPPPAAARGRSVLLASLGGIALVLFAIGGHAVYVATRPAATIAVRPDGSAAASPAPRSAAPVVHPERPPGAHRAHPDRPPRARTEGPSEPAPSALAPSEAPVVDERAFARARSRVSITMYSTSWCGVCAHARAYLSEHHVPFTERDVEESPVASRRLHTLNPRGSVPTFEIDHEVLVGFGEGAFESAVDRAATERLR